MEEGKPRLARLTSILTHLQSGRIITAREIADQHGISLRTVYRDIRTLEASGIPVVTEEGIGYSLMPGYKLPPIMFTEQEANALITAHSIAAMSGDSSFTEQHHSAIGKIKAVLRSTEKRKAALLENRIQVRKSSGKESTLLMPIQMAITSFALTRITYSSQTEEATKRTIEPFALYSTQGNWIVIAFCHLRSAFRAFRLDRIIEIKVLDECFEPHPMTLEDYFEACRKQQQ